MTASLRSLLTSSFSVPGVLACSPVCDHPGCPRPKSLWTRWQVRHEGLRFRDGWYCSPGCFEKAFAAHLETLMLAPQRGEPVTNRMPLGLVLLSEGRITPAQLREALACQQLARGSKHEKIGEWLVKMGAVSVQDVTNALALQQGCPVLARVAGLPASPPLFPTQLMQHYRAIPMVYDGTHSTLFVGFLDKVNRGFLYSLERMLQCNARPCIVPSPAYFDSPDRQSGDAVIFMDRSQSSFDMARTISSYAQKTDAEVCKVCRCDNFVWTRLMGERAWRMDFLFHHGERLQATI